MLTLPTYSGDMDGPTHTLGSTGGGDILEPRVHIQHKVRNQSQAIASLQKEKIVGYCMYLQKIMYFHSQIVEYQYKWLSLWVCISGYSRD